MDRSDYLDHRGRNGRLLSHMGRKLFPKSKKALLFNHLHLLRIASTLLSRLYHNLRPPVTNRLPMLLFSTGSDQVAKLWALRTFLITAYLTAVVICTSYSASLISVLTVKTPDEPFKELSDILSTDYKIAIQSDSMYYDFFAVNFTLKVFILLIKVFFSSRKPQIHFTTRFLKLP